MENIDRLVQLITDRLLENFQHSADAKQVYLIGRESTKELLLGNGCQLTADPAAADCVVVDYLGLDAFLRIASLCPADGKESNVLTALLKGQPVWASLTAFDVNQYKHSAKSRLYRELLQQKGKLEQYGLQFYEEDQLLAVLSGQQAAKKEPQPSPFSASKSGPAKKHVLITEAKLKEMNLSENDSFTIEKGMIVTALARDYLRRRKVRIVE